MAPTDSKKCTTFPSTVYYFSIFFIFSSSLFFHSTEALRSKTKCVHTHTFTSIGDRAYLVSPKYPDNYPSNRKCSYDIQSPEGSQIEIKCDDFNLQTDPSSPSLCDQDKFSFSLQGNEDTIENYCGQVTIDQITRVNRLLAWFQSGHVNSMSSMTPGSLPFRFNCSLTVVKVDDGGEIEISSSEKPPAQIEAESSSSGNHLENCHDCGVRNWDGDSEGIRIVGGTPASLGEFPWRCMLYSEQLGAFCGCSVLTNQLILTAAHCTAAVKSDDALYVDLGDYDLSTTEETKNLMVRVVQMIQNEAYDPLTQDHDISLLKLESPIEFSATIRPICLPWHLRHKNFHGAWVTASGWGITHPGGMVSEILQKVDLPLLTSSECRKYYGNIITDNMICTYAKGRDTCQGDSGSSIDYYDRERNRYYAVGIVSWGVGCAEDNEPGVYSKVVNFLDWIQENSGTL